MKRVQSQLTDDLLPPLPAFLDRKRWGAEQWEKAQQASNKARAAVLVAQAALERKAQEDKEAKKAKEATEARRKQERLLEKERREQRRIQQASVLQLVRQAMDKGPVTVRGLRQDVAEEKKRLVPWALRTMLRAGEAVRVSRQVYRRNKKHA